MVRVRVCWQVELERVYVKAEEPPRNWPHDELAPVTVSGTRKRGRN